MNSEAPTNKCIVLLVDDQAIIAEGIRRMLEDESDIIFHYCEDPGNAISMAGEIEATVILQDLVMPDIDGMTLVRYYRANLDTRNIPVIVLSSKDEAQIKSDAFTNGANDYLVKLPDKIELLARIRAHSRSYLTQLERDAAFHALREMQKQLEESNRKLQLLSSLDGLTGLSNRRHFDEELEKEWRRAQRAGIPLSLILIDIDHFKLYNDTYGHLAGDECLQKVAHSMSKNIVRPGDLLARYGGEEFVIILPDTDAKGAEVVAEHLRTDIVEHKLEHSASTTSDSVTISLGIAQANFDSMKATEDLIGLADKGLYEAKESGRNCYKTST